MAVLSEVQQALTDAGAEGWRREIAEALAAAMDDAPNASTAKELKTLMVELTGSVAEVKVDVSDELEAKRAVRRLASSS